MRQMLWEFIAWATAALGWSALIATCGAQTTSTPAFPPAGSQWSGNSAKCLAPAPGCYLNFEFQKSASGASISSGWRAIDLRGADVLEINLRVSRSIRFLQAVLTDASDTGAESSVLALAGVEQFDPNRSYRIMWPFRHHPGWVRYNRARVDWSTIKGMNFYMRAADVADGPVEISIGSMTLHTYREVETAADVTDLHLPWRVLSEDDTSYLVQRYFIARARAMAQKLHATWSADQIESRRRELVKTYMMPPRDVEMRATSLGFIEVDGIRVEKRLLNTRPGVYAPCNVYYPPSASATNKVPGLLLLPGHGDPLWSPSVQERALGYCKSGYVVYTTEPFGQAQRGFGSLRNESHGSMSTGIIIAAGQSLLGLIMYDNICYLDDLSARPEVDRDRVVVTGVSMGGTHTIWLAAIEPRLKAAVADAAHTFCLPDVIFPHHCICDLPIGALAVGDQQIIDSLVAPRPLQWMSPSEQRPISLAAIARWAEGQATYKDLLQTDMLSEQQTIDDYFPLVRKTYEQLGVGDHFSVAIVEGPHTMNKAMRERGAGWFRHALDPKFPDGSVVEPPVQPIVDKPKAQSMFNIWPDGKRPDDYLAPSPYALATIRAKLATLPAPPQTPQQWETLKAKIREGVKQSVRTDVSTFDRKVSGESQQQLKGRLVMRAVLEPEPGMKVPLLIQQPDAPPSKKIAIYLSPDGLGRAGASDRAALLLSRGWTVACLDPRGIGETRMQSESGAYLGFRDWDLCVTALKLNDTIAGLWARDLAAAIAYLRTKFANQPIYVWAERETGFAPAILAATSENYAIDGVVLENFLASYESPRGYGGLFVYKDEKNVRPDPQPNKSYGSAVLWIPNLLDHADVPQILAASAPARVLLVAPLAADGNPDTDDSRFEWTRKAIAQSGNTQSTLTRRDTMSDAEILAWMDGK